MLERLHRVFAGLVLLGAMAPIAMTPIAMTPIAMTSIAMAQPAPTQPAAKKKSGSVSGSPLDTLMHTHFRTTVPPAPDWIAATRPDAKTLDYEPLNGTDPERPKPRDKANVMALQAELEQDALVNNAKAKGVRPSTRSSSHRKRAAR